MTQVVLNAILILLAGSVIAVALFHRLRIPSILAYLLVGMLIGPHGMGWIPHTDNTHFLAEFGVVFLLFTIGLEFSIARLASMKKEVLGLGGAQVLLTTFIVGVIAWLYGLSLEAAIIVGGVLAMSSTAIVIKQLKDQKELGLPHGRLSVAILLFQDIAVVPFLIIIPVLAGNSQASIAWELTWALLKGLSVITLMLATGWWVLRPLFASIISSHSSELFTLTALLFAMAAAWISHFAGLSLALGAFLAGMILGETEFRHQIDADIRPFRDVLLGLFFVIMGMMLNVHILPELAPWILILIVALVLFKIATIIGLSILFREPTGVGIRTGIVLAQGGEFGLALLAIGLSNDLLDPNVVQILLATIIISMALTPILINFNGLIQTRLCSNDCSRKTNDRIKHSSNTESDLSGHVIIAGYGKTGHNLAQVLQQQGFDYIGLELDPTRVLDASKKGENVNYGDTSQQPILKAAGISDAKVLVLTYGDLSTAKKTIEQARLLCPKLPILVWTHDENGANLLKESGATEAVSRNREANLMLESNLLRLLEVPLEDIVIRIQNTCTNNYPIMNEVFKK